MKITNLIQIRKIISRHADKKISTALAYKMMKFMKASDNDEAFYNEKIREIIEKYGEKDENGQIVCIESGVSLVQTTIDECKSKIYELDGTEIDVPNIKFSLAELEQLKLSMNELFIIDELIEGGG